MTISLDQLNTLIGMTFLVYALTLALVVLMRLIARAAERRFLAQRRARSQSQTAKGASE